MIDDPANRCSRAGRAIRLFGCLIIWVSKLRAEVALSATEAERAALSQATRNLIPLLEILSHAQRATAVHVEHPVARCTVFEDNQGAPELAVAPKARPRARRVAVKHRRF